MTLGEKLRKRRAELGLSQAQVAGGCVTRNMLSRLEHDQAVPSMRTLEHLSRVLEVPMGWLLDGSGSEEPLEQARKLYMEGRYRDCAELLRQDGVTSEEGRLLLCRSALAAAEAEPDRQLAELAWELAGKSLYAGPQERLRAGLARNRWALLCGETPPVKPSALEADRKALLPDSELALLRAGQALRDGKTEEAEKALAAVQTDREALHGRYLLLRGALCLQRQEVLEAMDHLSQAEKLPMDRLTRLQLYRLLEICAKEQNDYRMAYQYASLRLELAQE